MEKFLLKSTYKKTLADTRTPVGVYLKVRDKFPNSILLESSDYHGDEHSYSYICCDPIASFELKNGSINKSLPDGSKEHVEILRREQVIEELTAFSNRFEGEDYGFKFVTDGIFGYSSWEAVQYFEDLHIENPMSESREIPEMIYQVYRYIIVMNHFNNEMHLFEHDYDGNGVGLKVVESYINKGNKLGYKFNALDEETSNFTDEEFMEIVQKGKDHCQRGDVFQIVLSRRFERRFEGDEFNVYRALRSINPSPYLFYFDFGNFKIFGSSPEAQIVIKDNKATIFPIAGTFRRTGNDSKDYELASKLFDDPKENSEHVMLVDLARNDLSRHGFNVNVEVFKDIQFYSHVIHLVSKVQGELDKSTSTIQLFADTFPAGTLSGAPKHMAMKLIDKYEKDARGYYGGAIGFMRFGGEFNHAIMIRTFLSKGNKLFYQAGAGVVAKSDVPSEQKEVRNKLAALNKAIELANEL